MSLMQPMMVAALLVGGVGVALLGSVKVPLARRLEIDEARVGGLVSLFGFIMMPVMIAAGFLTDQLDRSVVLVSGCVLLAASLGLLAMARRYWHALVAVVLFSAGWCLLINVSNVLTPVAFGDPKKLQETLPFATNLANFVFGLGAFLTPVATAILVRRASLAAALGLFAAMAMFPAALALGVDFTVPPPPTTGDAAAGQGVGDMLRDPILWLCGMALFFYGPLEASLAAWATTYLVNRGVRETTAAGLLSGFWLAYMTSRLATAFLLPPGREAVLILGLGLICALVVLGMVLSRWQAPSMVLVVAAGLFFGPIFPTIMSILLGHFDSQVHGRAVGMLFAIGGVGWTAIPILIGAYARRTSVQRALSIAVAAAVGLSAVAVVLLLR